MPPVQVTHICVCYRIPTLVDEEYGIYVWPMGILHDKVY
jgi:hypothetical protein